MFVKNSEGPLNQVESYSWIVLAMIKAHFGPAFEVKVDLAVIVNHSKIGCTVNDEPSKLTTSI